MAHYDCSIDLINFYCEQPEKISSNALYCACEDARRYYEAGKASKDWYEYVKQTLTPYIQQDI